MSKKIENEITMKMLQIEKIYDWFNENKSRLDQENYMETSELIIDKLSEALDLWMPGYLNFREACRKQGTPCVIEDKDGNELMRINPED